MVERIKNKKGFTIIEVMVVIALIGILAAVLVPQFGSVRDRAKDAGMLTNAKMVEAYVASMIDTATPANMNTALTTQFNSGDNALVNPYTDAKTGNISVSVVTENPGYVTTGVKGITYVVIDSANSTTYISGYDSRGTVLDATKRTLKK